jgi:hypothetical protein
MMGGVLFFIIEPKMGAPDGYAMAQLFLQLLSASVLLPLSYIPALTYTLQPQRKRTLASTSQDHVSTASS